jgi:hypothetical protein
MPEQLKEEREFCRREGIEVYGWGPDALTVKAESPDRAKQIALQLRPLGFEPLEDEDEASAGMLLLSRNPSATRSKKAQSQASVNISQRPLTERVAPVLEAVLSVWCFWYSVAQPARKPALMASLGSLLLLIFLWDGSRLWGWKLAIFPEELRVRRYFQWSAIPWAQIHVVEVGPGWGRNQESVILTLASGATLRLGSFGYPFSRVLRDRLRTEIAERRQEPK